MKISFIRGAYLNNSEGQNYNLPITGYSSLFPLDAHVAFPLIRLPSLADLQKIPLLDKPVKYLTNRIVGDSQILFELEKHIEGSDIVHVADPHYYYSYQAARLKAVGAIKKLILTWWETIPFNNESTYAKKRIKKYTMSKVDMFLCHNEKAKNCLLNEGVFAERITLIPLGVDLTVFRAKSDYESRQCTILFVGRLVDEKGLLDLYEAFKILTHSRQDTTLQIVGDGPLRNILQKLIQKDGLHDRVTIEHKSYSEMPEVFHHADIFCVPSRKTPTWEEQYGMVFVEAMASGLPILSYDTGAIKEVVEGRGILVEEGDIKGIVTSLTQLIKSRELRQKIGTMGRERAEKIFDAQKTSEKIYKLYEALI